MNRASPFLAGFLSLLFACGDDTSGTGGTGGSGGDGGGSTTSSSTKASSSSSSASSTSSSASTSVASTSTGMSSSSGGMCTHDVCTIGEALEMACDACVTMVCTDDDFCCDAVNGSWDGFCVDLANQLCNAMCPVGIAYGDLVITEIMNNPAAVGDTAGEWFEIFNASAVPIDLVGFTIYHDDMDPPHVVTSATPLMIAPGDYFVIGRDADPLVNGGVTVDYVATDIFHNNTADLLELESPALDLIDEVYYDEASGLDPDGASRNLDAGSIDATLNDDDTNFCEATTLIAGSTDFGTPGAPNDACP